MIEAIAHRGPDGRGAWLADRVALGHARLAVIDVETGQQPLASSSGDLEIVFNGEIYNYRELRAGLRQSGYAFRTHSDTEVILGVYETQGLLGLSRLRGMYAFAIWDLGRRQGLLVRDPLGIKPLFYRHSGDGELLFGSEAKAILAAGHSAELDEASLHLLLNFRYLPRGRSLFRGIEQLHPGEVLIWVEGRLERQRIPAPVPNSEEPLAALEESVRAHLTADVEVGAYLSGGIDSAAVVALAARHTSVPMRTFTLAVGDDPAEAPNAEETARILGVANERNAVAEDVALQLSQMLYHLEAPKINALQVSSLAQVTAGKVKVALSGLGGDELFYGYNAYRIMHLAARAAILLPASLARAGGQVAAAILGRFGGTLWSESERAARMLAAVGDWPRVYGLLRNLWDCPKMRAAIYGPRMRDRELPDAFDALRENWPDDSDPVSAAAHYEWRHKMVDDLLWNEDRLSMAYGLEVRVPFVDLRLHQAVGRLDRRTLMPRGRLKGYMRNMLGRVLPATILDRPKSGFQIDAAALVSGPLRPLIDRCLDRATIERYGLFNPAFVERVCAMPQSRRYRWHYLLMYQMLLSHLFIEAFFTGEG